MTSQLALAQDCGKTKQGVNLDESLIDGLKIVEVANTQLSGDRDTRDKVYISGESIAYSEDKRQKKTSLSPNFLNAVGRLVMTYANGDTGICTAELVSLAPGSPSRSLISGAHCLNGDVKKITWETTTNDGRRIRRKVTPEFSDSRNDIAVLSLSKTIPFEQITPLLIDSDRRESLDSLNESEAKSYTVAGFSSDSIYGENGERLTYHADIPTSDLKVYSERTAVKTVTYGGSSGGALIADMDLSKHGIKNPYRQKYLVGTLLGSSDGATKFLRASNQVKGSNLTLFSNYTNVFTGGAADEIYDLNR